MHLRKSPVKENNPTQSHIFIAMANGFVGISGALVAQYQGFADIGMGIGSIIFSLASVIIGEAILRHPDKPNDHRSFYQ